MPKQHDVDLREQAFALYQQGLSPERIGAQVGVSKSTVERWTERYGWKVRRDAIRAKTQKNLDARYVDQATKILAQLSDLREQVFQEISETTFRSKEGAISAATNLTHLCLKMMPREAGIKDEAWQKIVAALNSIPEVRTALERNAQRVNEALEKALTE